MKLNIHTLILGSLLLGTISFGTVALIIRPEKPALPPIQAPKNVAEPEVVSQNDDPAVAGAKKHTPLPDNEDPVVANVSDREKLQDQKFFEKAQNGDTVLMYPKNKKVFLYRPKTDEIVAQAPLDYQPTPSPSPLEN